MARRIKFHLDEHVGSAIAAGLRQRGIDVTTTIEAGLVGADDIDHVDYARPAGRMIFTHDDDYLALHAAGISHAGIAYCHQDARRIGQIIQTLELVWLLLEPAEVANRVEYL